MLFQMNFSTTIHYGKMIRCIFVTPDFSVRIIRSWQVGMKFPANIALYIHMILFFCMSQL